MHNLFLTIYINKTRWQFLDAVLDPGSAAQATRPVSILNSRQIETPIIIIINARLFKNIFDDSENTNKITMIG